MPEPIPALTLWQPWASLIQIGVKPFETRSWATRYRGPLAIHAGTDSRGLDLCRGEPEIEQALADAGYLLRPTAVDRRRGCRDLLRGQIVAVAELVQCWPTEAILADDLADPFGDYAAGRWAWHLHRVRPLAEPIPIRGFRRLWLPAAPVQAVLAAARLGPRRQPGEVD